MKKFIALAVLASSTVAFGAESAIYDIQYLPSPGTTYGFTTAEMVMNKIESDLGDSESDAKVYTQTIGHAFTDRWSLEASLNYANLETDPDAAGQPETEVTGISDPTISTRYRTVDEKFRWDVLGGATISLGDKEIDGDEINNYQGGHSLFVGTQFGSKQELFQWAISGILTHNMESTVDTEGAAKVDNDANNELEVRGDVLNKLAEKSFMRSHLSVDFAEGFDDEDNTEASAPATTWEIGTEYQHMFSQDLLARVGVDYQTMNQDTGSEDDNNTWVVRVGANYQF